MNLFDIILNKGIISLGITIKSNGIDAKVYVDDQWQSLNEQIYTLKEFLDAETKEAITLLKTTRNLLDHGTSENELEIDVWISRIGNDYCGNSPIGTLFDFRLMPKVPSEAELKEDIFKQKSSVRNPFKIYEQ